MRFEGEAWVVRASAALFIRRANGEEELVDAEFYFQVRKGEVPPGPRGHRLQYELEKAVANIVAKLERQ